MSGIILYQSKYGATERYARWLAEATGFDCVETKKAKIATVKTYDTEVLGGGIYAVGIAGIGFLRKNFGALRSKKLAVFGVGASPDGEDVWEQLKARNLKDALADVPLFYFRGAWDEKAMSFIDRNLCKMLQKSVAKQDPATYEPWQTALMAANGQQCDWTRRENLAPLLHFLSEA